MVFVLCLCMRHFVGLLLAGRVSAPRWCHAGSCVFRCGSNLIAAKLTLYFWATLSILVVSSSILDALSPHCGGFQVCRKRFMHVWAFVPWGMDASIIRSVILA